MGRALREAVSDFALFDNVISYEAKPSEIQGGEVSIQNTRVIVKTEWIKERMGLFEWIWLSAVPWAGEEIGAKASPTP